MHPVPYLQQPPPEIDITVEMVRRLLLAQHPDLADAPIESADAGWDNAVFRLGADLAVRLPRRRAAEGSAVKEHTWLPQLAPRLPLRVPAPVRLGQPAGGYPWHWSIVPWLEGTPADVQPPDREQGATLAAFFHALHVPAPDSVPVDGWRGVPLSDRRETVDPRMDRLGLDAGTLDRIETLWRCALEAPLDTAATWVHGDLHSQNVLVQDGKLCAVIDWGDLCRGDRATDLAAIWILLGDVSAREAAIRLCPDVSEATWMRARGWAIFFGVVLNDIGLAGNARHGMAGSLTLRRLVEGP
jgi:aminoglycoside phosphotransferase (APT) family kinase protein